MFGVPERAYLEEVVFSLFFLLVRVLEKVKNRQESRKKILLFSQVVLYHKFRKNLAKLAISAAVGWLPPSTSREEPEWVATRADRVPQCGCRTGWSFMAL